MGVIWRHCTCWARNTFLSRGIQRRFGWFGVCLGLTGVVPSLPPATVVMAICGIATGVINTYGISWLQRRTDPAMQGRVMSLVMLASMGTTPLAYAVSGVIADASITWLFVLAGGMIFLCGAGAAATAGASAAGLESSRDFVSSDSERSYCSNGGAFSAAWGSMP